MPFAKHFTVYYNKIFKPALTQEGYDVKRADDIFGPRPIMDDVRQSIKDSDLILCEMTGRNPNVYYELGLAHAIGKPVILISQLGEEIPFDVHHIRVIVYDTTAPDWSRQLMRRIRLAVQDAEHASHPWPAPLAIEVPDRYRMHANLAILRGRPAVVEVLPEIIDRAVSGDLLFGSCNTCSDYPSSFYSSLPQAVERGARVLFVTRTGYDNQGFIAEIHSVKRLAPDRVQLLTSSHDYLRVFGIENKEVIVAITLADNFLGIHARDSRVTRYFKLAFDEVVSSAQQVPFEEQ